MWDILTTIAVAVVILTVALWLTIWDDLRAERKKKDKPK